MSSSAPSASGSGAASRQKSCNACVKGKRRCDKRKPVCSRCAERDVPCVYTRRAIAGAEPLASLFFREPAEMGDQAPDVQPPLPQEQLSVMEWDFDMVGSLDMNFDPAPTAGVRAPSDEKEGFSMHPFFFDNEAEPVENQQDVWLGPGKEHDLIEQAGEPPGVEEVFDMNDYDKITDFCEAYEPWRLHDPTSTVSHLAAIYKSFHATFAKEAQTPFLHRHLYKDAMPPVMMACYTSCVLYSNQNEANKAMVIRTLHQNLAGLLSLRRQPERVLGGGSEAGAAAGLVPAAQTPVEKLARAQALLLYQTIRVFDGNITMSAQAEGDMALLEEWLGDLCKVRDNLGDLVKGGAGNSANVPPKSWERWVFSESVRRTILIAYSFITFHGLLKDTAKDDELGPWAYVHRWTLSRHLWEAPSSFDFYCRWKDKPQFAITNVDLEEFVRLGKGDDADEFAKIVLIVYLGVDATKQFFLDTGSKY